jgi:hypothetical protein
MISNKIASMKSGAVHATNAEGPPFCRPIELDLTVVPWGRGVAPMHFGRICTIAYRCLGDRYGGSSMSYWKVLLLIMMVYLTPSMIILSVLLWWLPSMNEPAQETDPHDLYHAAHNQ